LRCYASIPDIINAIFGTHLASGPPFTYGTCVVMAFGLGIYIGFRELKLREGAKILLPTLKNNSEIYPHQRLIDITLLALLGAILGSKIFNAIGNDEALLKVFLHPFSDTGSGLTVMGGLWGAFPLLFFYFKYHKLQVGYFLDALCPAFFIASMIGRLGCQLAGDGCWGIVSDMNAKPIFIPDFLWGQLYPHNISNQGNLIPNCTESHCHILSYYVFPTPIYEIILTGLFCIALMYFRKKWMHISWMTFGCFMILNGIERFIIEFVRLNEKLALLGMGWTKYQWVSMGMIIIGAMIFGMKINSIPLNKNKLIS
jgi:phosphatidylglycerol---prolipoprotein diacylglyceryl transferase